MGQGEIGRKPLPAANSLVETFTRLSRDLPLSAGLAALYVYEAQIPAIATAKIDGLKRFYGITGEDGLAFFTAHQRADVEHAKAVASLIRRHAIAAEDRQIALDSARTALQAVWEMLDCV